MAVNVRLKHSSVDSKAPVAADLLEGEVALNINENSPAAYIKDSAGQIVKLAGADSITDEASVKKVGDNMTGDLTLGDGTTDNITLDATAGSGTFAGGDISLNANGTVSGLRYISDQSSDSGYNFLGQANGVIHTRLDPFGLKVGGTLTSGSSSSQTPNISLDEDGSAEFSGDVAVGPNDTNFPLPGHRINFDAANGQIIGRAKAGAASFAAVTETGQDENFPAYAVYNSLGQVVSRWKKNGEFAIIDGILGTEKILLSPAGSATFAGDVNVGDNKIFGSWGIQVDSGTAASGTALNIINNGASTAVINADGSATFGGPIQVGGSTVETVSSIFYNNSNTQSALYVRNYGTVAGTIIEADSANIAFQIKDTSNNSAVAMYGNGAASFAGNVAAIIVPPSDARFKENITPAKPQLADVVALGGILKNYDWNDQAPLSEEIRSQRQLGLIAQEAETVCPAIVKDIHRTKQGDVITPEETIPAVYEDKVVPAEYKTVIVVPAKLGPKGKEIVPATTEEVLVTPEYTEQVLVTPEKVIPATYEVLDDSYKGISSEALIMKLIGAVTELSAEVAALKAAKLTKK